MRGYLPNKGKNHFADIGKMETNNFKKVCQDK